MKLEWIMTAVIMAALLSGPGASAQDVSDYGIYSGVAREQIMLFRGRQATSYDDVLYNGHYFWSTTEYMRGDVSYNGRVYHDILLNVDACEGNLLARYSMEMPAVAVETECVPWFTIGGQHFVNLSLSGVDAAPGYYQELSSGSVPVYLQVRKVFVRKTGNANGALIGYDDPWYDESIYAYFRIDTRYYCLTDGVLKRISRRKAIRLIAHDS